MYRDADGDGNVYGNGEADEDGDVDGNAGTDRLRRVWKYGRNTDEDGDGDGDGNAHGDGRRRRKRRTQMRIETRTVSCLWTCHSIPIMLELKLNVLSVATLSRCSITSVIFVILK